MYNTDFQGQLNDFRDQLFGPCCVDTRAASDQAYSRYSLPTEVAVVPCEKNERGEWVPRTTLDSTADNSSL
jgi:hypothetical protein